ncbi:MAG: HD domain-containing protein [Lachnospiraceae bacterium]|nr:HD domain-containing protein [Lachnospiraceae bacterium]
MQDVDICLSSLSAILDWFNTEYDLDPVMKPELIFTNSVTTDIGHKHDSRVKREEQARVEPTFRHREDISKEEITLNVRKLSFKFPYNIYERINTDTSYWQFNDLANKMFKNTVVIYNHGKVVMDEHDKISYIIEQLTHSQKIIQVRGLPGTGKNMILQLAFYRMLKEFEIGSSQFIPLYVSVNYYEQLIYQTGDVYKQIRDIMNSDLAEYIDYVKANRDVRPVLFIDAVREHQISDVIVENVLTELLKPLGKVSRIVSIDAGLIKNRARIKKVITVTSGDDGSCSIFVKPIPTNNKIEVMEFIDCILKMYEYEINAGEIYDAVKGLRYSELDIFLVRLLTKEMFHNLHFDNVTISEIYEKMALAEFSGDERKLAEVSERIFSYTFDESYSYKDVEKLGAMWSLAHKHHSFMEFLIAFYFITRIRRYRESDNYAYFQVMLTSMSNQFVASFLQNDYSLQETMVEFVNEKYSVFNIHQKSNAAYWMGRITYKNLSNMVLTFLTSEFSKLKLLVKTNNKNVQENLDNHFLFRAVCTGLLSHGQANMMDEYLCIVITNDIANALNRGTAIEYFGDSFQLAAHNTYYLDTDLRIGEKALIELNERIEASLYMRNGKFVENNLVTMLTILQARIQNKGKKLKFDIIPYVHKALEYLKVYRTKPQNVASSKIIMYFDSIKEDLECYLSQDKFDIAPLIYNKYRGLKDVKRKQWLSRDIYDPESVSEHSFSAWLMAALFLPEECNVDGYIKKEILDMIMIHDMAEAELGDRVIPLNEPTSDLEGQNYVMKKLFLKGTYPDIANLTYYYNVWTGYYNGININAKVARDVNLIQTVYTFLEYYCRYEQKFTEDDLNIWLAEKNNLITDIGYNLFDRLITENSDFAGVLAK